MQPAAQNRKGSVSRQTSLKRKPVMCLMAPCHTSSHNIIKAV